MVQLRSSIRVLFSVPFRGRHPRKYDALGEVYFFDLTAVDFAAKAAVHVAVNHPGRAFGKRMHLQNPAAPIALSVIAKELKGWDITDGQPELSAYMDRVFATDAFKETAPSREDVIWGWAEGGTAKSSGRLA